MANKAVLIFDIPKTCNSCQCACDYRDSLFCTATERCVEDLINYGKRPDWCPLIEVTKSDIARIELYLNRIKNEKENRI